MISPDIFVRWGSVRCRRTYVQLRVFERDQRPWCNPNVQPASLHIPVSYPQSLFLEVVQADSNMAYQVYKCQASHPVYACLHINNICWGYEGYVRLWPGTEWLALSWYWWLALECNKCSIQLRAIRLSHTVSLGNSLTLACSVTCSALVCSGCRILKVITLTG